MEATELNNLEELRGILKGSIEDCWLQQKRALAEEGYRALLLLQGKVEAYAIVLELLDQMERK